MFGAAAGCTFVAAASVPCVTRVHSVRLRAINPANFIPTSIWRVSGVSANVL